MWLDNSHGKKLRQLLLPKVAYLNPNTYFYCHILLSLYTVLLLVLLSVVFLSGEIQ